MKAISTNALYTSCVCVLWVWVCKYWYKLRLAATAHRPNRPSKTGIFRLVM